MEGFFRLLLVAAVALTGVGSVSVDLPPRKVLRRTCPARTLMVSSIERVKGQKFVKGSLSARQVAAHIGKYAGLRAFRGGPNRVAATFAVPQRVHWVPSKSHYFSCWDGRGDYELLGTPGGDIGEFVLALRTLERMPGYREFTDFKQIRAFFEDFLATRVKFYLHTDYFALQKWAKASGVQDPMHPKTAAERKAAVHYSPRFMGCEHLQAMMVREVEYDARRALIEMVIRAVVSFYIDPAVDPVAKRKILFVVQRGYPREERAFVDVLSPFPADLAKQQLKKNAVPKQNTLQAPKGVLPESPKTEKRDNELDACAFQAPMIEPGSPTGHSMIVFHPRAVYEYRARIAEWMTQHEEKDGAWKLAYFRQLVDRANKVVKLSKQLYAAGLPTYLVSVQ